MNKLKIPSTHELLRDLEVNVFSSVKSKEFDHFSTYKEKKINVYFQLSNLYRLLNAESYQAFSMDKEKHDKLSQKEKQKQLKEWSKKSKPFCKKADAKFKGKFRSSLVFYRDFLIYSKKYYNIKDFNAIVDFIVQEKLLVPTIDPLPKIDMNDVESYALQAIEQGPLNYKNNPISGPSSHGN
ncbi:hypothetical protein QM404_00030 [Streptococcus infantis]|uniref:hypothetical protein n=1 Tax=Streptococcus infantis TaxID=68892 RepID=UPI0039C3663E